MPTSSTDLRFQKLLDSLKERYQFRELMKILKEEELGSAGGWNKLLEKLNEADNALANRAESILNSLNTGLILAGTKDVFVFPLDRDQTQLLANELESIVINRGVFSEKYPFSLTATELHPLTSEHELVKKEINSSGDISFVLCAKRREEDRVSYKYNEVTEAVQSAFIGYDEFVAIRRTDYQVFDVITLRRSLQRLEILIDQPAKIKSPETSEKRYLEILGRLASTSPIMTNIYEANNPLNLAPCVSGLYHARTEGRVSNLSFRTPTGSVNKGALPTQDLRTDVFHKNGVEAVGDVTPYDVTISWDGFIDVTGAVSVQVGMPLSSLSTNDCYVKQARIIGARSDSSVILVVNKLVSYSTD